MSKNEYLPNHHASYLKHLIIMEFKGQFDELVMILKRTPNLTNLTINVYDDIDMINANQ